MGFRQIRGGIKPVTPACHVVTQHCTPDTQHCTPDTQHTALITQEGATYAKRSDSRWPQRRRSLYARPERGAAQKWIPEKGTSAGASRAGGTSVSTSTASKEHSNTNAVSKGHKMRKLLLALIAAPIYASLRNHHFPTDNAYAEKVMDSALAEAELLLSRAELYAAKQVPQAGERVWATEGAK